MKKLQADFVEKIKLHIFLFNIPSPWAFMACSTVNVASQNVYFDLLYKFCLKYFSF